MSIVQTLFGDPNKKIIEKNKSIIEKINLLEKNYTDLTNDALKLEISLIREKIKDENGGTHHGALEQGQILDQYLEQVFAITREASKRVLNMRHFDV